MSGKKGIEKINGIFKDKDILDSVQFSAGDINMVFKEAGRMRKAVISKGGLKIFENKVMAPLFFEPSSRTFSSFASSMLRLGGSVIPLPSMQTTSVAKGESFEDTIKVFSSYADVLVIRHPESGSVTHAANISAIPVINAGDGIREHPTQALCDLYTIKEAFGSTDGLNIIFFGELAHYRPVNSLAKLLSLYPKTKITFISPSQVKIQSSLREYLKKQNTNFSETETISNVIEEANILYVTRVKKEFMTDELYKKIKGQYAINKRMLSKMKKKSIVMHALPRIDEIHTDVDNDPRAVYLRSQIRNGLYIRMALLSLILGKT